MFSPELARQPLSRLQRATLLFLLLGVVAFGSLVELRSAFLSRRMGDLGCYLRGAWAVRTGADLYWITDDNNWHYNYPPLLAILMTPLADPPTGFDHTGMIPYEISVAVWFWLSVVFLLAGVHWLANALEERSADPAAKSMPWGCRRWWALRILPVLVCLVPVGHTWMRGQVNMLVLLLFCGMIACVIKGRSAWGGLCLAGAICIKLYPAFLLVYALWRRDWRFLGGCMLGLFAGLILIPLVAFGPVRTYSLYKSYAEVLIGPALGISDNPSRAYELTNVVATDSQSIQAAIHNAMYPDRFQRPRQPAGWVLGAHWLLGGLMTLITLLAAGRKKDASALNITLFLGALLLIMLFLSPVCHLHYFAFAIPLVIGLLAQQMESGRGLGWGLVLIFLLNFIAEALPNLPGLELTRDLASAFYGGVLLWLVAVGRLRQQTPAPVSLPQPTRLAA
jgi:hypothetical protein